jgi:hypothetical protein
MSGVGATGDLPQAAYPCTCAAFPTVAEEVDRSKAVFSGYVLEVEIDESKPEYIGRSALIMIRDIWKGELEDTVEVRTAVNVDKCGAEFSVGTTWVIFVNEYYSNLIDPDGLYTLVCFQTQPLFGDDEILHGLGPPIRRRPEHPSWGRIKHEYLF